jgi:hypothetical protein
VLRLSIVVNECTPYQVKPSKGLLDHCNQFLGPTQPGVTTADPTRPAAAASSNSSSGRDPALDFLLGR